MATANCPQHGTPLNGFGNLTFCNACDAEAEGVAPEENSEHVTIYLCRHSPLGSTAELFAVSIYYASPHSDYNVPYRVRRSLAVKTAVTADGTESFMFPAGTTAEKVEEDHVTIYRRVDQTKSSVRGYYSTYPHGRHTAPWKVARKAVQAAPADASKIWILADTHAEKVRD